LKFVFRETLDLHYKTNCIETVHTPQLVFVCYFPVDEIPEAHAKKFDIITIS
jgi:hypothetical protein